MLAVRAAYPELAHLENLRTRLAGCDALACSWLPDVSITIHYHISVLVITAGISECFVITDGISEGFVITDGICMENNSQSWQADAEGPSVVSS